MKISTLVCSLRERRASLALYTGPFLPYIDEVWELAVDISVDFFPIDSVEYWVHLGYFTDYDPVTEEFDLLFLLVSIKWEERCVLEPDRAHVVIIAVVDVSFSFVFETCH